LMAHLLKFGIIAKRCAIGLKTLANSWNRLA
jgi:hypothetical protein